jgi:uncharacterized protein YjiS (DUF1127 family)
MPSSKWSAEVPAIPARLEKALGGRNPGENPNVTLTGNHTSTGHTRIEGRRRRQTLAAGFIAAFDLLSDWTERNRQRRALLALSDTMLKDIGVSRADALQEGEKPFWK